MNIARTPESLSASQKALYVIVVYCVCKAPFSKKINILNMCQAWKCERKELNESDYEFLPVILNEY